MINRRINLIPYPWQVIEKIRFRKVIVLMVIVFFIILISLYLLQMTQIQKYRAEIRNYRLAQEEINYKQIEVEKLKSDLNLILSKKNDLKRRVEFIEKIRADKVDWTELLRELTLLIPERVWLSKLSVSQSGLGKKGKKETNLRKINVIGSSLKSESIPDFVTALEGSPKFSEVELSYVAKKDVGGEEVFNFEISFNFKVVGNEL